MLSNLEFEFQPMKKIIVLLAALPLLFASCQKDEDSNDTSASNNRILNTNLSNRVTYHNEDIQISGKRSSNVTSFTYVADVSAPTVNGAVLSATGIDFEGNRAYVSYHWNGNDGDYAGALEVVDITDPTQPQLVSSLFFTDADLNEVYVEGNKAYVVGGRDIYSSGYNQSLTDGGIVEVVTLQGGMLTTNSTQSHLPSYSGNSVFKKGNDLYVTSGNTGGGVFEVSLQNNNYLQVTNSDYYDNSKFGVNENGKFIFLEGGPNAKLHVFNSNQFNPNNKTTVNLSASTSPLNGKGVLYVDHDTAYVSAGSYGLFEFNINGNGTPTNTFSSGGTGYVNGVSADKDFVFVANGHDGLYILDRDNFNQVGLFQYNASANYVATNGQSVFIANGRDGLKILSRNNGNAGNNGIVCSARAELTPSIYNTTYTVNKNDEFWYRSPAGGGNTFVNDFINNGEFHYCGSMRVITNVVVKKNALLDVYGSLTIDRDLNIEKNGKLIVEGALTVVGNLNYAGEIEFVGAGASVVVYGNVNNNGGTVTGTYTGTTL